MVAAADAMPERVSPLWTVAFRPFFLAVGLWGVLAVAAWIVLLVSGGSLPSRFDPLGWHVHAMLFGFVFAAIAGFLLTAVANWTGRRPVGGTTLMALAALWLLGRAACAFSAALPLWLAAAVDLAFPFAVAALVLREILAAKSWRNLPMPLPVVILGLANLLVWLELGGVEVFPGLGWRLGLAAVLTLVSAVAGRIIPAFTRNWLMRHDPARRFAPNRMLDRVASATLHTGLLGWAIFPTSRIVGVLLVVAAALNLWRLANWQGWAARREPLLAILHVGYLWVIAAAALLGGAMLTPAIPEAAAVHAGTSGAIGTMILAVMTRVARGHTGRPIQADGVTVAIYVLIVCAGIVRVAAAFLPAVSMPLLMASAALWVGGYGLFVVAYSHMLLGERADVRSR